MIKMENKTTFAKFLDNCFYCILLIFISILWSGYFFTKIAYQLIFGIIFGTLLYLFAFKFIKRLKSPQILKKTEEKHMHNCLKTLSIADPEKVYKFFEIMLKKQYVTFLKKPFLEVQNKQTNDKVLIYCDFLTKEFSLEKLYQILSCAHNSLPVLIFSNSFSSECLQVANSLAKVELINAHNSYLFFKKFNTFPKISTKTKEKMFSNLKKNIFSNLNTKKYLKASLILILLSIFTKLKIYYLSIASILFLFAIITKFKSTPSRANNLKEIFLFE